MASEICKYPFKRFFWTNGASHLQLHLNCSIPSNMFDLKDKELLILCSAKHFENWVIGGISSDLTLCILMVAFLIQNEIKS